MLGKVNALANCNDCLKNEHLRPCAIFKVKGKLLHLENGGLMTQHHLRGLLLDSENELGRSVLVLQKIPEGCLYKFEKGICNPSHSNCKEYLDFRSQYVNIEAHDANEEFALGYSPFCRAIHKEIPAKDCEMLPNECRCGMLNYLVATYFLGNMDERRTATDKLKELEHKVYLANETQRVSYMTYICPYSGYMECAFEIKYCGLSAVLVFGQFLVDDGSDESKQNIYFHNKLSEKYGVEASIPIKPNEIGGKIEKIFEQINKMLEHLNSIYKNHSYRFTNKYVEKIMQKISNIEDSESPIEKQYDELKYVVWESIYEFADKADIQVSCFMTDNLNERDGTALIDEKGCRIDARMISQHQFIDMALLEVKGLNDNLIPLRETIKNMPNGYTHLMFSKDKQLFNMLILIRTDATNDESRAQEISKKAYEYFFKIVEKAARGRALGLFYEYQSEAIKRFNIELRHELGQSNTGFLINTQDFAREYGEGDKNFDNYIRNAYRFAYTTMLRTNVSRYMWGTPEPTYMKFRPYERFLFKWSAIYYNNMKSKDVTLKMFQPIDVFDPMRPDMDADPDMIEQVAYNLTNNAMKYGLPGTTVSLDCCLNETRDMYQLLVTSYGLPLNDGKYDRIFERGYQGHNAIGAFGEFSDKDSGGIGLALAREIAEKHGGMLELTAEKVSDLCMPYCVLYKKVLDRESELLSFLQKQFGTSDLRSKIPEEIERLKKDTPEDWKALTATKIENSKDYISSDGVVGIFNKGVFKYVFVLSIPHKGRG
jgi:hypothetical protein